MFTHIFLAVLMSCPVCGFVGGEKYMNDYQILTQIPRDIPHNVKKIYLNNNCISSIEGQAFAKNTRCTNLRLDWNQLTEVRKDMWTGLVSLKYLSLEHNYIEVIEPSAFSDLPNLKGLYLDNNKLTTLSWNIFPLKQMPVIEVLTLHGNILKQKDLGWLYGLCEDGQIQQYTMGEEAILCRSASHNSSDKKNVSHNSTQQTQEAAVTLVNATTEDTTTGDYQTTIVDDITITWVTGPEPKYALELPGASKNVANNREYSHQDLVTWILISAGGATVLCVTALVLLLRSKSLIAACKREKKLKRIHQRQENRPAPPLPTPWRNTHTPNTLQGLQEYQTLVENPSPSFPETHASTTHTNQSSDGYAVPYQHMLGRFIAFMSMYQRRRPNRRSPPPVPPETILSATSTEETSNGYLEPVSVSNTSARASMLQKSWSDCHYQEPHETALLGNRLTVI